MVMFYLLISGICKNKSRPVTYVAKCCFITSFMFLNDYFFMSWKIGEKVIFFLSNFHWLEVVFSWFSSTRYVGTSTWLVPNIPAVLHLRFVQGSPFSCTYFCVSGTCFYLGFSVQSPPFRPIKMSSQASELLLLTSFENGLILSS